MNQGRIWCVVNPTVGLPLLLGSVAITSLIVHASVMTHTTWMSSYWSGSWRNKTAEADAPKVADASAFTVSVTPMAGAPGKNETSFVVSVATNPAAKPVETAQVPGPLAQANPPSE